MRCINVEREIVARRNGHLCFYCDRPIEKNERTTKLRFHTIDVFGLDELPRYAHNGCYDRKKGK